MSLSIPENHRILIIDDNPDIHADFRKILTGRSDTGNEMDLLEQQMLGESCSEAKSQDHFIVDHAHQGEEGYERFLEGKNQSKPYFAAFIDMRMPPGWDGLQTIQAIREIDQEATLVVCTAYSDHSWDEIARESGAFDKLLFLKKPFDPVEVQALARSLRERWSLLKQAQTKTHQLEEMVRLRTRELEAERSKDKMRMDLLEKMVYERTSELRELAMTDNLTGLPNRIQFFDHLLKAIDMSHAQEPTSFAVMYLDFDRFKAINDNLGHGIGDKYLKAISTRIDSICTDQELFKDYPDAQVLAARLGGDEFCVLIQGVQDKQRVIQAAKQIHEIAGEPSIIEGNAVQSSASIGMTFSDIGYQLAEEVLRDADTAMYVAKSAGGAGSIVFEHAMHNTMKRRATLENDLRNAVSRLQMELWFQPIVSLSSNNAVAAEGLIRWRHPELGLISPMDFIPLAEETGQISELGIWVFEEVCRQLQRFPDLKYMSFNVSRCQISDPGFLDQIDQVLERYTVDRRRLVAEITETALARSSSTASDSIDQLRERGIRVFLDDFGSGYSSLSSLRHFHLDGLKLDRSFLDQSVFSRRTAAVIDSMFTLANDLNVDLIIEGVESLEQVVMLQALQCEYAQGYLFSHPVPLELLEQALLGSQLNLRAA